MLQKSVLLLMSLLLLTILAIGCASNEEMQESQENATEPSNKEAAEKPPTVEPKEDITLTYWRAGTDELTRLFYEEAIKEYENENPHITINFSEHDWGDIDTRLNLGYASGTAPDVVRYVISSIAQRASQGQYMPLDELIDGWEEKDDILPAAFEIGSYDGTRYGISVQVDPMLLLYRKDHFEEAGLDPEKPPVNWEELKSYTEQLTVKDGDKITTSGLMLPTSGEGHHHIIMFIRQNGGNVADISKNIPTFDQTESVEALDFLTSFRKEGLLLPYNNRNDESLFDQGRASMMFGSKTALTRTLSIHPEWEELIGIAEPPMQKQKSSFSGAQIYFISNDTKYKEESWEFIKFLSSKEKTWELYEKVGTAVNRYSLKEDFISDNPIVHSKVFEAMEYGDGNPKVTWAPLFLKWINTAYEEAMHDTKTGEQALKDAVEQLEIEMAIE